jgi:hypothetical protein
MSEALAALLSQVDPVTAGLVVAMWLRWEAWTHAHQLEHQQLQQLRPHEVNRG